MSAPLDENTMIALLNYGKLYQDAIEAKRLEDSFYEFVKAAWPHFDPADFCGNWHLEDACRHLEEVARGHINRLLINVPPRTAKSSIASICFVPWVWAQRVSGPLLGPKVSFFYASYAEELALDHSLKARRLIESKWYQKLWGGRFKLVSDRNKVGHFENDKGGYRMSSSVSARSTGWGASVICLPPGEKVLTDIGWKEIDAIVDGRQPVKIAGHDHATGRWVWQDILKYEKNHGGNLVEIRFAGGAFRCTEDHPVFVEGRGYVRADSVKAGEILWALPEMSKADEGAQPPESAVPEVRFDVGKTSEYDAMQGLRRSGLRYSWAQKAGKWAILLAGMFWKGRKWSWQSSMARGASVLHLREVRGGIRSRPETISIASVLQPVVRNKIQMGQDRSRSAYPVRGMWDALQERAAPQEDSPVLFKGLQECRSRSENARRWEPAICPWRVAARIWKWMDEGAEVIGAAARWICLPGLRFAGIGPRDGVACPPHQLRQGRYVVGQFDLGMQGLPRPDAWEASRTSGVERAIVHSVERGGYAETTYNLNVTPCHNYFVGGALVHNCADDPHLVREAESDAVREDVIKWWSESMPSRLNDRRTGAMVVIMQRVHEGDVAGHVLASDMGYVHFCVPMCYVPCKHVNAWNEEGKIKTYIGDDIDDIDPDKIFWADRRIQEGELLWPDRYPASEVSKLEVELGPYAFAGQYQQDPAPRGGGIIRREWWKQYDDEEGAEFGAKPGQYPPCEYILASLDTAYTEKEENDPSALSIWGIFRDKVGNPQVILMVCWAERMMVHDLVVRVGADCKKFKVDRLIIEDKAAGHSVSQEISRLFGNFDFGIELVNPRTGFIKSPDKVARLQTVVHMFAEGLIWAPDKTWADEMIKQCALVPRAIHDDLADTCSQALIYLRRAGWIVKKEERALEIEDETRYRPKFQPLYPA